MHMRLTARAMPSPNGTNYANRYLVHQSAPRNRRGMAHDEAFAGTRADLIDAAKGDPRQRLLDLISKRLDGGTDAEIESMLERLGKGAPGEQRPGASMVKDQLSRFLRG